jgi:hypothetical protein
VANYGWNASALDDSNFLAQKFGGYERHTPLIRRNNPVKDHSLIGILEAAFDVQPSDCKDPGRLELWRVPPPRIHRDLRPDPYMYRVNIQVEQIPSDGPVEEGFVPLVGLLAQLPTY